MLCAHTQVPSQPKSEKLGWEAVDTFYWGYINTKRFTKLAVPDADGFKGSKEFHEFVGVCRDAEVAERTAPMLARRGFCADDACLRLKFGECQMTGMFGRALRVTAPRAKGAALSAAPMLSLEQWAEELAPGMLVAVRAHISEQRVEGEYWLANICSKAFTAPDNMVYAGAQFEVGICLVM